MWVLYTLNCLDILGSLQTLLTKVTLERSKKKMTRDLLYFRSPLNTRHTEKIHKVPLYSTIIINMILVITAFTAELQHVRHCALSFDKNKVNDIWMVNNTSEKSHSQSQSAD